MAKERRGELDEQEQPTSLVCGRPRKSLRGRSRPLSLTIQPSTLLLGRQIPIVHLPFAKISGRVSATRSLLGVCYCRVFPEHNCDLCNHLTNGAVHVIVVALYSPLTVVIAIAALTFLTFSIVNNLCSSNQQFFLLTGICLWNYQIVLLEKSSLRSQISAAQVNRIRLVDIHIAIGDVLSTTLIWCPRLFYAWANKLHANGFLDHSLPLYAQKKCRYNRSDNLREIVLLCRRCRKCIAATRLGEVE